MGVSVRQRRNRSGWWVYCRHAGTRTAFRYDTEGEAQDVARAFRYRITLGELDLEAVRAATEKQESEVPTVGGYYETVFRPVYIETAVADSTAVKYVKNFKITSCRH